MFKQIVKSVVKGYLAVEDAIREARQEYASERAGDESPVPVKQVVPAARPAVQSRFTGRSGAAGPVRGGAAGKTVAQAPSAPQRSAVAQARRKGGPSRLPFATWLSKQRSQRPPEDPINQLAYYWFSDEERPRTSEIERIRERLRVRQASPEMVEALDAAYTEYDR